MGRTLRIISLALIIMLCTLSLAHSEEAFVIDVAPHTSARVIPEMYKRYEPFEPDSRIYSFNRGIDLLDVYSGPSGLLTGSARLAREAVEASEALERDDEIERLQQSLESRKRSFEAQISLIQTEHESQCLQIERNIQQLMAKRTTLARNCDTQFVSRRGDARS